MIILAILVSVAAISGLCWLLFTIATYALPALAGVAAGIWAFQTGMALPDSVLIGLVGAGLTFGIAYFLILVGIAAFARVTSMTPPAPPGQTHAGT